MSLVARSPYKVKEYLMGLVAHGARKELTRGEKGALIGALNKALGGDQNRRLTLAWLFGHEGELSSKELDADMWWALWNWVDFWKDDGDEWQTAPTFNVEACLCFSEAVKAQVNTKPSEKNHSLLEEGMMSNAVSSLGAVVTCIGENLARYVDLPSDYPTRKKIMEFIGEDEIL